MAGRWVITALMERRDILGTTSSSSDSLLESDTSSLVRSVGASTNVSGKTENNSGENRNEDTQISAILKAALIMLLPLSPRVPTLAHLH